MMNASGIQERHVSSEARGVAFGASIARPSTPPWFYRQLPACALAPSSERIPLPFIKVRQVEVLFLIRERKSMNLTKMSIALRCEKYFKILHLLFCESILCQNIFSSEESCLINGRRGFPQKTIKHTSWRELASSKHLPD